MTFKRKVERFLVSKFVVPTVYLWQLIFDNKEWIEKDYIAFKYKKDKRLSSKLKWIWKMVYHFDYIIVQEEY
jgi:hypothetical protein